MTLAKEAVSTILATVASLTTLQVTAASTTIDTSNAIQVAVWVEVTYGANNTGMQLQCFGSLDDQTYSTKPFATYDLLKEANTVASKQVFGIANAPRYIQCKVYNPDTVTVTNVAIKMQRQLVT